MNKDKSALSQQEKIWSRDFVLVFLSKAFNSSVFSMLTATVALYSIAAFDATVFMAGFAVGAFIIAAIVSRIFAGYYIEVVGRRRMMLIGSLCFLVACALYFLPLGYVGFLVVRILHGVTFGVSNNTLTTLGVDMVPKARETEGISYFSLSATLSSAIGPFIGSLLVAGGYYNMLFVACLIFAFVSLGLAFFFHVPPGEAGAGDDAKPLRDLRIRDFIEISAIPYSFATMIMTICAAAVTAFVMAYAVEQGIEGASYYFLFYSVFMIVSRPLMGRLADRRGEPIPMLLAFSFALLSFLLLGVTSSLWSLLLSALLMAFGSGTTFVLLQAAVVKKAPESRIGVATATYYVFADGGQGLGPTIMGGVITYFGYVGMFNVEAGAAAILLVIFAVFYAVRRSRSRTSNS